MKRLTALLLLAVILTMPLLLTSCRGIYFSFEYELTEDGTGYRVVGYEGFLSSTLEFPESYNGKPVKEIGEIFCNSVDGIVGIQEIRIPASVEWIEEGAFYDGCSDLLSIQVDPDNRYFKSINGNLYSKDGTRLLQYARGKSDTAFSVPDTVTQIGSKAFYWCSSLESISLPDTVTEIGEEAFCGCYSLESISLPDTVTEIGGAAFYRCSSLESISLPDTVTEIGEEAFYGCDSLESIRIPDAITEIGQGAFDSCNSLQYNDCDNGYYLGNENNPFLVLLKAKSTSIKSITIPSGAKVIYHSAFQGCGLLESVRIPDTVTQIGASAFFKCDSLKSVWMPNSLTKIGWGAFSWCGELESIYIPKSVTSIEEGAFFGCYSLDRVAFGNPNGWWAGSTALSSIDLSDPERAADYLSDTYYLRDWTRK